MSYIKLSEKFDETVTGSNADVSSIFHENIGENVG